MTSYLDLLPSDCMEIVLTERISTMEKELEKLDKAIRNKLKNDYKKEKKRTPRRFNFNALRAAVNYQVYTSGVR